MELRLTPAQEAFVRQAIESGRFHRAEDALEEALLLWEERERKRGEFLATLDDAKASLARGEGRVITQESMRELAEDVKRRGLARLTAEQQAALLGPHARRRFWSRRTKPLGWRILSSCIRFKKTRC